MVPKGLRIARSTHIIPLLLGTLFAATLTGCPQDEGLESFYDQFRLRYYNVFEPPHHDGVTPLPVIIAFHGFAADAAEFEIDIGLDSVAAREGFYVVYPVALRAIWRFRSFGVSPVDTATFIDGLLDHMMEKYPIDENRIFLTGLSQGGLIAQEVACELSHRIAAVAPVSGAAMPIRVVENCNPSNPPAFLGIHGTNDGTIPFAGQTFGFEGLTPRIALMSVTDTLDFWSQLHGCDEAPITITLPITDPDDGTSVRFTEYQGCGGNVALYTVFGGGHTWPGSARPVGNGVTSREINAGEIMWEFFQAHPLQ